MNYLVRTFAAFVFALQVACGCLGGTADAAVSGLKAGVLKC